jgi:hypothetical protein
MALMRYRGGLVLYRSISHLRTQDSRHLETGMYFTLLGENDPFGGPGSTVLFGALTLVKRFTLLLVKKFGELIPFFFLRLYRDDY